MAGLPHVPPLEIRPLEPLNVVQGASLRTIELADIELSFSGISRLVRWTAEQAVFQKTCLELEEAYELRRDYWGRQLDECLSKFRLLDCPQNAANACSDHKFPHPKSGSRMQRLKRFLPMFLNGSRYDTTPDTGSLENAISADEVRRLGLKITGRKREFLLGNGSKSKSLGVVRLKCAFARGERCVTRQSFNVFDTLVVPVIIGKTFLDISQTMTLHRHRLEAVWMSAKKAFRVMHLNRPRQLVRCYVNGKLVHANPDTGSEVDLLSPSYAHENMLKIEGLDEGEGWVQFADGRTAKLLGKTHVNLDMYDGRYRPPTAGIGIPRTFYLLDGLRTDILLGDETLSDMHVFTKHEDSFVESDDCGLSVEMSLITWFDKRTRQMSETLAMLSSASSKQSKMPRTELLSPFSCRNSPSSSYKFLLTSSL